ncbi:MAG TPA: hypothetical protein VMB73_33475 [Acetobacteraceae bacterium]|nr:hypothetical protein [Acetobacteraceae bacterium]
MARPKADLDSLAVPKDGGDARPAASGPEATAPKNYAHTLSLRLTADQYRRLRRYVADQEDKTGKRATHQAIIEAALDEYLTNRSA